MKNLFELSTTLSGKLLTPSDAGKIKGGTSTTTTTTTATDDDKRRERPGGGISTH